MYQQEDKYGQRNANYEESQNQAQNSEQPIKTIIGTEDVRDMVRILNQKPFGENFTLVTFDELNTQEQLELLNKILIQLDNVTFKNIKEKSQDQIMYEVTQFLTVLNYPVPTNPPQDTNWQNGLFNAEKRIIYPVFYYLLTRLDSLKKRAYLGRYLIPYQLPEGIIQDDEIKKYMDEYKDFQAEFQVTHTQFEEIQKESTNPEELKKEISQLQQEREQLTSRINVFKSKNTNNPQFQSLLEVTNLLRKEQEEEARIQDKLRQQKAHLEWTDQQLLASQQRLHEAKKSVAPENTPEQMLMSLRNEVKKNRELANERLAVDINEKRKKLEETEKLLSDPPITQNELSQMENNLVNLRRAVNIMEEKLSREGNPDKDKLTIYKQQAALVTKKKERALEDQKRVTKEMEQQQKELKAKEDKISKERGPGFSNDEFKNFVEQLKVKNVKYKKLKSELADLKNEISLLSRTESILKEQQANYQKLLEKAEREGGVIGAGSAADQLNQVSENQQKVNEAKGKTLEEISQLVSEIKKILDEKKNHLQPLIKVIKEQREEFKTVEQEYKTKKGEYDKIMVGSESEIETLEREVARLKEDVEKEEKKINEVKANIDKINDKTQKLDEEVDYQKGKKTLSSEHKSYVEKFADDCKKLEEQVQNLRQQREIVKDNYEPHQRQIRMFQSLKVLLEAKLQVAQNGGNTSSGINYKNQSGNVNQLVIDN